MASNERKLDKGKKEEKDNKPFRLIKAQLPFFDFDFEKLRSFAAVQGEIKKTKENSLDDSKVKNLSKLTANYDRLVDHLKNKILIINEKIVEKASQIRDKSEIPMTKPESLALTSSLKKIYKTIPKCEGKEKKVVFSKFFGSVLPDGDDAKDPHAIATMITTALNSCLKTLNEYAMTYAKDIAVEGYSMTMDVESMKKSSVASTTGSISGGPSVPGIPMYRGGSKKTRKRTHKSKKKLKKVKRTKKAK